MLAHPTIVAQCVFFILWILTLILHVPLLIEFNKVVIQTKQNMTILYVFIFDLILYLYSFYFIVHAESGKLLWRSGQLFMLYVLRSKKNE